VRKQIITLNFQHVANQVVFPVDLIPPAHHIENHQRGIRPVIGGFEIRSIILFAKRNNMKLKWMIITTLVAICSALAFHLGKQMGVERTKGLCRGTLVTELSALQNIRTGNVATAVSSIEQHCYGDTIILLESPKWRKNVTVQTFMPELVTYRTQFSGNATNWSPTEVRLEQLLKDCGWKK
jgi:hypothetical protein